MRYTLNDLYNVVQVSRQAVHKYQKKKGLYNKKLQELLTQIDILREDHPGCGIRKMYHTLKPDFIGRDRFEKLLMGYGYRVHQPKNYIRTTIPAHYKYPNLIEGSCITDINKIWQSDITYILVNNSYYYIVFIIDVYSRRIVGYQASDHLRTQANILLIHHSDRGSQYVANDYVNLLRKMNIEISMGAKATDNAYAERVNGIIKNEYLHYRTMNNLNDLRIELKKAVSHYNYYRLHNSLSRTSPVNFERKIVHLNNQKKPTVTIYTDGYDKINEAASLFDLTPEKNLGLKVCPII